VVEEDLDAFSLAEVQAKLKELPAITTDKSGNGDDEEDS